MNISETLPKNRMIFKTKCKLIAVVIKMKSQEEKRGSHK